jgi:hypothetical protein
MAAYPDLPQIVGSQKLDDDGTVLDFAESGKPRLRQYYTQVRTRFNIIHDVDGPDKDTLVSHYDGDKTNVFSFTFKGDSVTYSVRYTGVPQTTPVAGTDRWRVVTNLVVV